MGVGQTDIRQPYIWIEGAEAERPVGLFDRDRVVTFQARTSELKPGASANELESANDRSNAVSAVS